MIARTMGRKNYHGKFPALASLVCGVFGFLVRHLECLGIKRIFKSRDLMNGDLTKDLWDERDFEDD